MAGTVGIGYLWCFGALTSPQHSCHDACHPDDDDEASQDRDVLSL